MYGKPSAPEHLRKMAEHTRNKGKEAETPKTEQPAPPTPAPSSSQPPVAVPPKPEAPTPKIVLPPHRRGNALPGTLEAEENAMLRSMFTSMSLDKDAVLNSENKAARELFIKKAEEQGLSEQDALNKNSIGKVTAHITKTNEQGERVLDRVEVTDGPSASEPTSKAPKAMVFPNDAYNARVREGQDAKKAEQLSTITASGSAAAAGPNKKTGEAKPPTTTADKGPSYYREWYRGNPDEVCRMSNEEDAEVPWNDIWGLWYQYFGNPMIEPETGTPFEVRVPAHKSRFFFGPQGMAIKNIIALCLTPILIFTRYEKEWFHIGLWFRSTPRIPRVPMLQMWAILQEWAATIDQGMFFDKKLGQDLELAASTLAKQLAQNMREQKVSIAVQETIKARDEEERKAREMARQMREAQLAQNREDKKQWLLSELEDILAENPDDMDYDRKSRSRQVRSLVKIDAEDEGLYGKDVGYTKSDVWAFITDHWSKTRPKQAAEPQALMYGDLS